MSDQYKNHFKTLRVEDGNFHNENIQHSLKYFVENSTELTEDIFPYLITIYDNFSNVNIQADAAKLFLKLALKNGRVDEIMPLTQKSYGYYSLTGVLRSMAEKGTDISPLFPLLYTLASKDKYGFTDILNSYFKHKSFELKRREHLLITAKYLAENEAAIIDLPGFLHGLLIEPFPEEDIRIQKAWVSHPKFSDKAISALHYYIPKYLDRLSDILPKIMEIQQTKSDQKPYAANDFLLRYAYYTEDEALLKSLIFQPDYYFRQKCLVQLGSLIKDEIAKNPKHLHYFLNALKTEEEYTIIALSGVFSNFIKNGLVFQEEELNELISRIEVQSQIFGTLNVLETYGSTSEQNKSQLLIVLKNSSLKNNPYLRSIQKHFNGGKEATCGFCRAQPYSQNSDLPKKLDSLLKTVASIGDTTWKQCLSCGQDYSYYYYVEYDVNSAQTDESLTKINPAALLKYTLPPELQNQLKAGYTKSFEKAESDFFSPYVHLREAAAVFLMRHYCDRNDEEALCSLFKLSCTTSLKLLMENYSANTALLKSSFLSQFLDFGASQVSCANIMAKNYIREADENSLLKLLKDSRTPLRKGTLWAINYPGVEFIPSDKILQAVYLCGIESAKELSYIVESTLVKYKYTAKENSVFSQMKILEEGTDRAALDFALRYLNNRLDELPAFNESLASQLLIYSADERFSYYPTLLIAGLLKQDKLDDAAIQLLLDRVKLPESKYGFDFNSALFARINKSKNPNLWVDDLAVLLLHPHADTAKNAAATISDLAEKGISIAVCMPALCSKYNSMDPYENEKMIYAATIYYHNYHPERILSFLDELPSDKNRAQAVSRISDLAYHGKDISLYYNWLAAHIFSKQLPLKESCFRALYYALKKRPEDEVKLETIFQPIVAEKGMDLKSFIAGLKKY